MAVTIDGSAGVTTNSGAVYNSIQQGTSQASTSGTSIDFTSIPSWVKRITVMFNGVSTSGTSIMQVQLGTSGGVETSGYAGAGSVIVTTVASSANSAGFQFPFGANNSASLVRHGVLTLTNLTGNTWAAMGIIGDQAVAAETSLTAGTKALSGTLDRVRITTVNGTDTFDAGSINILYE